MAQNIKFDLPKDVELILDILHADGNQAYVVGGCVRDYLLGKVPDDWDICTDSLPEKTKRLLSEHFSIIPLGIQHGTIAALNKAHERFEITTFRIDEVSEDGRHPNAVRFTSSLSQDLSRRDFTINAMVYNHLDFANLGDVNGLGIQDLNDKLIRCVGDPNVRFAEDGLRILRALRFSATLGFEIESQTAEAIHSNKELLKNVSNERFFSELKKLVCGQNAEKILLDYSDVLGVVIPEILPMVGFEQNSPWHCYDVWTHTVKSLSAVEPLPELRLSMLLHDIGKPNCYSVDSDGIGHCYGHPKESEMIARTVLRRLNADNDILDTITMLVGNHDKTYTLTKPSIKRLLNSLTKSGIDNLLKVKNADISAQVDRGQSSYSEEVNVLVSEIILEDDCFNLKMLKIKGQDLLAIGLSAGPIVGKLLNMLLQEVINEKINNEHEELLLRALQLQQEL